MKYTSEASISFQHLSFCNSFSVIRIRSDKTVTNIFTLMLNILLFTDWIVCNPDILMGFLAVKYKRLGLCLVWVNKQTIVSVFEWIGLSFVCAVLLNISVCGTRLDLTIMLGTCFQFNCNVTALLVCVKLFDCKIMISFINKHARSLTDTWSCENLN